MNYWWVSQNQTHKQEIGGGYMWSPKADKNGNPVQSYTNMKKVSVGDLVFAFYQSKVQSIGTVLHPAGHLQSQKNLEHLGTIGLILVGWSQFHG
jgi:putative restriction endonuclease